MAQLNYAHPVKRINAEADLDKFRQSLAYKRLQSVIAFVVEKVHGCEVPTGLLDPHIVTRDTGSEPSVSDKTKSAGSAETAETADNRKTQFSKSGNILLGILDSLNAIIDETPPLEGPRRFGNMACRDWHQKVKAKSLDMLSPLVGNEGARMELNYYLINSFGSELRLDFGSGHELSFLAFIGGLLQAGILDTDVSGPEILALFARYYDVARRLILVYSLEPAGSHGVWGLDDHFHFIYILGAAEYTTTSNKPPILYTPPVRQTLSSEIIRSYKLSNLYVNAISFIFKLKSGPFNEHSPILFDVTRSVSLWAKVQSGLLKMYEVEVLGKFPVVQHFWFGGKFFPWADARTNKELATNTPKDSTDPKNEDKEMPGLINNFQGTNTTKSNIAITRAPWANPRTPRAPIGQPLSQPDGKKSSLFSARRSDPRDPPTQL